MMSSHYDRESASNFLKHKSVPNLSYLIYRDLPLLLNKYISKGRALDYGCGPGLSTRFLANLGFEVIGVDINKNMLEAAFVEPDGTPFAWIKHAKTPFAADTFDLVLSVMVLLEMPSLDRVQEAVNEITRVLKPGGIFLAAVGSEHFHKYEWIDKTTFDIDKCQNLAPGDVFYGYSKSTGIRFRDYFYSNQNYIDVFDRSNLKLLEIHRALGLADEEMPWGLERTVNPFTHYVCRKGR
ncbi:MAG TPA: class I SAM-dependent methyltransferase [Myxococcota bacterium]|nr:class I SAM-dependent methyltransferase [Myxococcota bacterium]